MANAFCQRASFDELLEVMEITVCLGLQSATSGLRLLIEETSGASGGGSGI